MRHTANIYSAYKHVMITENWYQKLMQRSKTILKHAGMSIERVVRIVCDYLGQTPEKIILNNRKREIVEARQICHYFSKIYVKKTLSSIGFEIGGKNHATVLHSSKTVINLCETDKYFKNKIDSIDYLLNH